MGFRERSKKGQAAVEYVLLILVCVLVFGWLFYHKLLVTTNSHNYIYYIRLFYTCDKKNTSQCEQKKITNSNHFSLFLVRDIHLERRKDDLEFR